MTQLAKLRQQYPAVKTTGLKFGKYRVFVKRIFFSHISYHSGVFLAFILMCIMQASIGIADNGKINAHIPISQDQ